MSDPRFVYCKNEGCNRPAREVGWPADCSDCNKELCEACCDAAKSKSRLLTYEHWLELKDGEVETEVFALPSNLFLESCTGTLKKCCEISGSSHEELMQEYYNHKGWGTYKPVP